MSSTIIFSYGKRLKRLKKLNLSAKYLLNKLAIWNLAYISFGSERVMHSEVIKTYLSTKIKSAKRKQNNYYTLYYRALIN